MYAFSRFEIIRWANNTAAAGDEVRLTVEGEFIPVTVTSVTPGVGVATVDAETAEGDRIEIAGDLFNNLTNYLVEGIKF